MIRKFLEDESGVTLIEYALIAGFIAIACVIAVTALGGNLQTAYGNISTAVNP